MGMEGKWGNGEMGRWGSLGDGDGGGICGKGGDVSVWLGERRYCTEYVEETWVLPFACQVSGG